VNPVIIEGYDARWPGEFQIIRGRVAAVLKEKAAAIEHVGSTAVPGLAAKPIIDIDVLLKSEDDLLQQCQERIRPETPRPRRRGSSPRILIIANAK
jgi:GrpB-like predicted nucleotidyltransferase (UPF0157 family)